MHELLEELDSPFKEKFKKEVSLTEITRYSLNLHKNTAVVVTNSYLYVIQKKLVYVSLSKFPISSLEDISFDGSKLKLNVLKKIIQLPVAPNKKESVKKFCEGMKALKG